MLITKDQIFFAGMQLADATKLNGVVITSSPSAMPAARIQR
jgi:hypothetical protein